MNGVGVGALVVAAALAVAEPASANTWEPPEGLGSAPTQSFASQPGIAISPSGDEMAVYSVGTQLRSSYRKHGRAWAAPQTVATVEPNNGYQWEFVTLDSSGAAVGVWVAGGLNPFLQTATRPPGGVWTAPQTLSKVDTRTHGFAVGPRGDIAYVWDSGGGSGSDRILGVVRPPGGPWGPVEQISEPVNSPIDSPGITFDAQGNAIGFWDVYGEHTEVAFRPAGGGWGAPRALSGDPQQHHALGIPNVAFDSGGNAIAVFYDAGALQTAYRPAGGDFGTPQTLSGSGSGTGFLKPAQIAFDASRTAVVVWGEPNPAAGSSAGRLWTASRPAGGSFTSPQPVTPLQENAWSGSLAVEPDGTALVLAGIRQEGPGTTSGVGALAAYVRHPGGGFDAGTAVAPGGASDPMLAAGGGEAAAVWRRDTNACRETLAAAWTTSPLSTGSPPCSAGPVADTVAPHVTLTAPARERGLKTRKLTLSVKCDEDCTVVARGKLTQGGRGSLKTVRRSLPAGRRTALALRLPKLRGAAAAAKRMIALVTVTAADAAGNKRTAKRRIVLTR
jgi:hypothetical protein